MSGNECTRQGKVKFSGQHGNTPDYFDSPQGFDATRPVVASKSAGPRLLCLARALSLVSLSATSTWGLALALHYYYITYHYRLRRRHPTHRRPLHSALSSLSSSPLRPTRITTAARDILFSRLEVPGSCYPYRSAPSHAADLTLETPSLPRPTVTHYYDNHEHE